VTGLHEVPPSPGEGARDGASVADVTGTDDPRVEAGAASRVIYFSDAVVAIAITLLALGLPLPNSTGSTTNSQLLHALAGYWDEYLAFAISFVVIGGHWARHRSIFRYVSRVNHRIGQLTLLWLLMMVLTPFAARLLAGSGGFGVRFTLYVVIQVIASGCLVLMSREVVRGGLQPDAPETARHPDDVSSLTIIVLLVLSVPVAFYTAWAFALWVAIPFVTRALRWHMARTAPAAAADAERAARRAAWTARLNGRFRVRSGRTRWW
jgi:uncharacterized membrane protein